MIKYDSRKKEIYDYYSKCEKIDSDNISDINDKLVDEVLTKDSFVDELEELYNTVSICNYMIENNLYDSYFFESINDILNDYDNGNFGILQNDSLLDKDIDNIKDYLKKDEAKEEYYNKLSEIYDKEEEKNEEQ